MSRRAAIGPSTQAPEPADQATSVATSRTPASRRFAWNGQRLLQTRLAAAGFDDLTPAQARIFARIGPNGTRSTALAEQARVTRAGRLRPTRGAD